MSLATKFFVICAGGCGLIPFFMEKERKNNSNDTETRHSIAPPSGIPLINIEDTKLTEEKNCKVIDKLSENVFWELIKEEEDYITVSCKNVNIDANEIMPNNWKGLFPKVLFKSQEFHKTGFELEIRTKTEKEGTGSFYNTFFYSKSLENDFTVGEWDKQTTIADGRLFVTINAFGRLGKTNPIYLLFPDKKTIET